MMRLLGVACVLAASAAGDFVVPQYTVDLDKDPYDAWGAVAADLLARNGGYENTWGALHAFLEDAVPHDTWVALEPLWDIVHASFPDRYQKELDAIVRWIHENGHTEWTKGQLVMCQLFYEVEDGCTSIVTKAPDGSTLHGRNLDYGLPGLQNMTIDVTFTRGGDAVARGTMYLGYMGLLTGQHVAGGKGTWGISLDQRFPGKGVVPYVSMLLELLKGTQNVGFTLRDALLNYADYATATKALQTEAMPAPAYLIMSGTGKDEGMVITRDRHAVAAANGTGRGVWELDTDGGEYFRLETNYDNWEPDTVTDGRRAAARAGMAALGAAGVSRDALYGVLSSKPVLNGGTTYTAMMEHETGYYWTEARVPEKAEAEARRAELVRGTGAKVAGLRKWFEETLLQQQRQQ